MSLNPLYTVFPQQKCDIISFLSGAGIVLNQTESLDRVMSPRLKSRKTDSSSEDPYPGQKAYSSYIGWRMIVFCLD